MEKPIAATPASRIRADLFTQLGAMEAAGLTPQKAWELLDLPSSLRPRLQSVRKAMARGVHPVLAARNAGLFAPIEAQVLQAACTAGSPAGAYRRLATICTTRANQAARIRARLVLPLATFVLAVLVQPLPLLVGGKIGAGTYAAQAMLRLGAMGAVLLAGLRTPGWFQHGGQGALRTFAAEFLLALPVLGRMHERRNVMAFCESLGLLLEAGVPMFDALPIALKTVGNQVVRKGLATLLPAMKSGKTLTQALRAVSRLGNRQLIGYVETGESSGSLPEMLARFCEIEGATFELYLQQLADWAPRLVYGAISLWIAYGIVAGAGVGAPSAGELP